MLVMMYWHALAYSFELETASQKRCVPEDLAFHKSHIESDCHGDDASEHRRPNLAVIFLSCSPAIVAWRQQLAGRGEPLRTSMDTNTTQPKKYTETKDDVRDTTGTMIHIYIYIYIYIMHNH